MRGQLKFVKANLCTPVVPAVISVNSSRWSPSTTGPRLFIGLFHPVLMDLKGLSFDKDWLGNRSIAEFKEELSRPLSYLHQRLQWCQNFRIYSEFLSFLDSNGRICQKFWVFFGAILGNFWPSWIILVTAGGCFFLFCRKSRDYVLLGVEFCQKFWQ